MFCFDKTTGYNNELSWLSVLVVCCAFDSFFRYSGQIGTNLIHDFTSVTLSVKLAFFREKRRFP